jgi:1-acyl-sn-glycerol-3-phosphate acyltransferase
MRGPRGIPIGRYIWGPVLRLLIRLFLKIEMSGLEHLPATGAGIVYYNHIHWLDPVLISAKLPRYTVPLAKIETSRWPVVGVLMRWYHVIFITRGAVDRDALKATWDVLAAGHVSTISPEGTRSLDMRLQRAKEGLAFVAKQAPGAWLLPCAVQGTPAFSWSLKTIFHHPLVTLRFGPAFKFTWPERPNRDVLREMTDEAMIQLAQLLPAEMRGDYAEADPQQHRWLAFLTEERGA